MIINRVMAIMEIVKQQANGAESEDKESAGLAIAKAMHFTEEEDLKRDKKGKRADKSG